MIGPLLALVACGPGIDQLMTGDPTTRAEAIRALPAWRARRLVPELEECAASSSRSVSLAALEALVRADTDAAFAPVEARARRPDGYRALVALDLVPTKRSCDLLAALCILDGPWQGRQEACSPLRSGDTVEGWPCFRSLDPYRESSALAEELWRRARSQL